MEKIGALNWNVRKIVSKGDYYYAIVPEHPNRTKNNYVLLHRIIMENHLGRLLNSGEVVHHIDEDKKNNNILNLQVLTALEHSKLHGMQIGRMMCDLKCPNCGKRFSRERRKTHLIKTKVKSTCCSSSCRGQFSRKIQLGRLTIVQVESAISENILRVYNTKDNTEGTHLQETP